MCFDFCGNNEAFNEYFIFFNKEKNLCILEKLFDINDEGIVTEAYADATYVFDIQVWQQIQRFSKKEIMQKLKTDSSIRRIIHDVDWEANIEELIRRQDNSLKDGQGTIEISDEEKHIPTVTEESTENPTGLENEGLQYVKESQETLESPNESDQSLSEGKSTETKLQQLLELRTKILEMKKTILILERNCDKDMETLRSLQDELIHIKEETNGEECIQTILRYAEAIRVESQKLSISTIKLQQIRNEMKELEAKLEIDKKSLIDAIEQI